jgi:two-component system phosphate regulon sensor histidine kinase PhoR
MLIRSRTLRLGIFISTCIIAAIIIFQLIWLKKVYNYEQKEFDHSIIRAVRGLYEDVNQPFDQYYNLNQLIRHRSANTFTVHIEQPFLKTDSLAFYMQHELEDEDIFTDCHLAIFNAAKQHYSYTAYLRSSTTLENTKQVLPLYKTKNDYILLNFPHRSNYVLSRMNYWIVASVVLLFVLLLFGGSFYFFYRQRFLNETQKDFVNNFTHEFKTPVAVIGLAADVLAKDGITNDPSRFSNYVSIVQYQTNYLHQQINRLLSFAQAETNVLPLHLSQVHLHEIIEESIFNLQPLIQKSKAKLQLDLEANNDMVLADRDYMLIVITNLIENAIKYAVHPIIEVRTVNGIDNIKVSIKDNGKGIDKKYHDKIFDKFFRVTNGEEIVARGFGIGLSFVKRIIKSHGGKITVDSIPAVGSTFIVTLPYNITHD